MPGHLISDWIIIDQWSHHQSILISKEPINILPAVSFLKVQDKLENEKKVRTIKAPKENRNPYLSAVSAFFLNFYKFIKKRSLIVIMYSSNESWSKFSDTMGSMVHAIMHPLFMTGWWCTRCLHYEDLIIHDEPIW